MIAIVDRPSPDIAALHPGYARYGSASARQVECIAPGRPV